MNVGKMIFLGVLVGMRSMTLPAVVSNTLARNHRRREKNTLTDLLSDENVAALTTVAAAGEILVDKLPFLPARTEILPLTERMGVAGLLAAGLAKKEERILAAVIAAAAAALTSFLAAAIRIRTGEEYPDKKGVVALTEDALTVGGALLWRNAYLDEG